MQHERFQVWVPQNGALASSRLSAKLPPIKVPRAAGVPREGQLQAGVPGLGSSPRLRDIARAFPVKDTPTNEEEGLLWGRGGFRQVEDQEHF